MNLYKREKERARARSSERERKIEAVWVRAIDS